MHVLSHWDGWFWDGWFPLWTGGLWLLLPLMMILFCFIGMSLCGRMGCGGRWMTRDHGGPTREGESPLDIAKRRYAQGEISKEQYEDIKRTLTTTATGE